MEYNNNYMSELLSKPLDHYVKMSNDQLSNLSQVERMNLALAVIKNGRIEDEHTDASLVIPRFDSHTNVLTENGKAAFALSIARAWWDEIKSDIRDDTDNWYADSKCTLGRAFDTHLVNEINYRWDYCKNTAFIKGSVYYNKFGVDFCIETPDDNSNSMLPQYLCITISLHRGNYSLVHAQFASTSNVDEGGHYRHRGELDYGLDELECLHDLNMKKNYEEDYRHGWSYRLSNMYDTIGRRVLGTQMLYALLPKVQHLKANLISPAVSNDFVISILKSKELQDYISACIANIADIVVNGQVLKDVVKEHTAKELKEAIKHYGGDPDVQD